MPVRDFSEELFSKSEGYGPAFLPNSSTNYELLQSFLFYIFEIYVHLFLRNTLLQILLIELIFYKKTG